MGYKYLNYKPKCLGIQLLGHPVFNENKYFAAVINHAQLIFPTTGHAQERNNISH